MWGYRRRLERDVRSWEQRGLISPEAATTILSEMTTARGPSLASALSLMAAVLMGFAAMSFIAANWQDMPKLLRLAVMIAALGGCYAGADQLFRRGRDVLAHGAVLAGVLVFGASIMLISQMYHMDGHPPQLLLVWGIGALGTGLLAGSAPALAAAMALFLGWSFGESAIREIAHFPFLVAWAVTAAGFYALRWRPGFHVAALALAAWVIALQWLLHIPYPHVLVAGIGAALVLGAMALATRGGLLAELAPAAVGYGAIIAMAGLIGSEVALIDGFMTGKLKVPLMPLLARVLPALALIAAAIAWAWRGGHQALIKVLVPLLTIQLGFLLVAREAIWLLPIVGALIIAAGYLEHRWAGRVAAAAAPVLGYGLIVAFVGLYDMQFNRPMTGMYEARTWAELGRLAVLAVIALTAIVGVLSWAVQNRLTKLQWIGFALFAVEIVAVYSDTLGSLLGASLFFLIASLILAGLAWLAVRLHARNQDAAIGGTP